jgi:mono/diheme cytochrome c family protein
MRIAARCLSFSGPLLALSAFLAIHPTTVIGAAEQASPADGSAFYKSKIFPVLSENCYSCHGEGATAGLRVDTRDGLLKGGESGAALVPGDPGKSLLIQAVQQVGVLKMPKGGAKLPDAQIADLIAWVKMGAPFSEAQNDQPAVPVSAPVSALPVSTANGSDYFENQVRPVLADKCYSCHADDAVAGLRVDSRAAIVRGGKSGPAIVPGDPDNSLLIKAVEQTGTLRMPKGGKLTAAEVKILADWVKMGAPWQDATTAAVKAAPVPAGKNFTITPEQRAFWSFQPLRIDSPPVVKDPKWVKTPIDRFILAKLETTGIQPAPQADKRTLIRRATLDLTGLPPTPEEIAAFEKDKSAGAFAKVVDRLLASPRYGERWGRHWLDVARYAEDDVRGLDPKGRGYMPFEGAYVYRDWVIKSVNNDMPYDQFIRLQLAGDLIDKSKSPDSLAATAFLGGGPWVWDQAEPVQGRADERNERIDAVSRGLVGLTVACARCHDHKYDPISQKDYYALAGVFASSTYKEYPLVSDAEVAAWQETQQKLLAVQEKLDEFNKTESKQLASIYASQASKYMVAAWQVSGKPKEDLDKAAEKAEVDPELLARWVKVLARPPKFYSYLKDWQAMIATGGTEDEAKALADAFQKLLLQVEAEADEIKEQNDIIKAKADVKKRSRKDALPNEFETDDQFCPGCLLELKALPTDKANLWLDFFMRSLDADEQDKEFKPGVFVFYGWGLNRRLGAQWQAYVADLEAEEKDLKKQLKPRYPFVHGMSDKPKPVNISVNLRGNPHSLGDEVPRRYLAVLTAPDQQPFSQGSGRLELADRILDSPISTRVFVNRIWKWHFGTGIVNTPDNFGKVGDPPSNPALLDFLASEFKKNGMSIKKLNREIMLSAVYQTTTTEPSAAKEKDGANRLYSHFNRQRLDAESIRDSILFVSGDLDLKNIGGPSTDFSPENTRRTVYCKISRFRLNNYLQVFDFPNPSFTAEQRFSTNVPLQRLFFMNNEFVYQQAGKLAERVHSQPDDSARITEVYKLLYGRSPTPEEMNLGLQFLKSTPEKPGYEVAGKPITAWHQYARVLLSSNEFEFMN